MKANTTSSQAFDQRLRRLLVRVRGRALYHGLVRWSAVAGAMTLAAVWALGGRVAPGAFNGWGLSLSWLLALICLAANLIVRPWRRVGSAAQLANRIEQEADFANLVVAAEEAGRCPERWPTNRPVAEELRRRLYRRALAVLDLVTPANIDPVRYARTSQVVLATVVLAATTLVLWQPGDMARGAHRLLYPVPEPRADLVGGLFTLAGGGPAIAGSDVQLNGVDFADVPVGAQVEVRAGSGSWQVLPTHLEATWEIPVGLPSPYRRWQAEVANVREDFVWRLRRGGAISAPRPVAVRHYPLLTDLAARVTPPAYTKLPARDFERLPAWIEVPAGSRLDLTGRLNHPVNSAVMVTEAGDTLTLASDSLSVSGSVAVPADLGFTIDLVDGFGLPNRSPLPYQVAAAVDAPPVVSLERPEDDGILPLSGEFALVTECADDYGLARLSLLARTGSAPARETGSAAEWDGAEFWSADKAEPQPGDWREIPTPAGVLRVRSTRVDDGASALQARFGLEVRADGLDLVAGDGLDLIVEVVDNKRPLPAGRTRSPRLRLQLPSAAEILVNQGESNGERRDELAELRRRSRDLGGDLDRLTRELMKNPVPDWARQQEMEAAIDRQQKLQAELARVAEQLRRELEQMAQSQLVSEAQLDKADQMSELLNQDSSAQLNDLVEQLKDGGQASPQDVARAMDEVSRNQQDMARRLDAALAMLKRMAQEQELEGLTALLEKMIQKQQELADLSRRLAEQQAAQQADAPQETADPEVAAAQPEPGDAGETAEPEEAGAERQDGESRDGDRQGEPQDRDRARDEQNADNPQTGEQAADLARRQKALEEELAQLQEQLEQALENLQQENRENPSQANEDLSKALTEAMEQVKQQRQADQMGQAGDQLEQMDPQEAAKMQEQAVRDLGSLYSVLLKSQQAMQQAMKMEQVTSLRGLAADLLALSARQEQIAQTIPAQLRDVRSRELTRSQHRLQKAASHVRAGLSELMAEAPNRIMKLLVELDKLIGTMGSSLQAMEDNRAPQARQEARTSLAETNRIVIGLLTEAQMQGGGSGGSSTPQSSLSEKLQQMIQQQAGLNGVTEELRRMLADRGISQQARSQMHRLGEQQAEMAGRLGELAEQERQQPEGERLLGDLAEMGRDMERIGREIDQGLVSEETLVRQDRILSRMLDARNSVRRRDFSSRRESRTARDLYTEQSGGRSRDQAEGNSPFRLKYQPLEKAPMEYRDLVRRYFAALDSLGRTVDDGSSRPRDRSVP